MSRPDMSVSVWIIWIIWICAGEDALGESDVRLQIEMRFLPTDESAS